MRHQDKTMDKGKCPCPFLYIKYERSGGGFKFMSLNLIIMMIILERNNSL